MSSAIQTIAKELVENVDRIRSVDAKTLCSNFTNQRSGGKPFDISEMEPTVTEFLQIINKISKEALLLLPEFKLRQLKDNLMPPIIQLDSLHNYKFEPSSTYESQSKRFTHYFTAGSSDGYHKHRDVFWPIIVDSLTLLQLETSKTTQATGYLEELAKVLEAAKRDGGELETLLKAGKEEIGRESVSKHADIFNRQAETHRKNANKWGAISVILVILNVATILVLYSQVKNSADDEKLQLAILSLLLISLISYSIVITVRSYFAEKHNQVINKHKANCLGSFNTFTESASDSVKDVVLQYTAQTIFSQYNPGFLNKDNVQSPSPIIELLRTVNNESKGKGSG